MSESEIMTIDEVAKYLKVPAQTINEWVSSGKIHGGQFGQEWRFKRSEIKKWVDNHLNQSARNPEIPIPLDKILDLSRITIMDSGTKNEALQNLIELLTSAPGLKSRKELEDAIFHREKLMSTGIGLGVAVPHVRLPSIKSMSIAIGINKREIVDYESLDNQPVRIMVMVAAGKGQHQEYIRLLAYLSSILKEPEIRQRLFDAQDTRVIYDIIAGKD